METTTSEAKGIKVEEKERQEQALAPQYRKETHAYKKLNPNPADKLDDTQ